jgi:hypothetical protein
MKLNRWSLIQNPCILQWLTNRTICRFVALPNDVGVNSHPYKCQKDYVWRWLFLFFFFSQMLGCWPVWILEFSCTSFWFTRALFCPDFDQKTAHKWNTKLDQLLMVKCSWTMNVYKWNWEFYVSINSADSSASQQKYNCATAPTNFSNTICPLCDPPYLINFFFQRKAFNRSGRLKI